MKSKRKKSSKRTKTKKFFLKSKKIIIVFLAVFILIISALYESYALSDNDCIIMITDSHACHCIKKRCFSLKNQISDLLKQKFNNNIRFKVIEYRDKKRAEKIMNKYNMGMVPAVVIVDKKGNAVYNGSFFDFKAEEFTKKLFELKGKRE